MLVNLISSVYIINSETVCKRSENVTGCGPNQSASSLSVQLLEQVFRTSKRYYQREHQHHGESTWNDDVCS